MKCKDAFMIKANRGRSHERYLDVTVPTWLKAATEVLPVEESLFKAIRGRKNSYDKSTG